MDSGMVGYPNLQKKDTVWEFPLFSLPIHLSGAEINLKNNPDRPCWMAKPHRGEVMVEGRPVLEGWSFHPLP
jgi:hypothetical protein